jgi:hypothetical protein
MGSNDVIVVNKTAYVVVFIPVGVEIKQLSYYRVAL